MINWFTVVAQIVNFLILIWLLQRFLYAPITDAMARREERIQSRMAAALKAEEVKRRRYAAHAVMLFGHKVEDKAALWPLVQPLVAAHFHDPDEAARRSAGLALERTFGRTPEPN